MNLRRRNTRKDQALDAVASVTKTWSEWQLAKRAGKGVAKAKEVRPSKIKAMLSSKRAKLVGAVAVTGGVGAFVARKLKGGDPASYTGPAPSDAVEAAASAPEAEPPPPLTMAPDPATESSAAKTPAVPETALRYESTMPAAADVAADTPPPEPDFSAVTASEPEPDAEPEPEPVAALDSSDDDDAAVADEDDDKPATGTAAFRRSTAAADDDE